MANKKKGKPAELAAGNGTAAKAGKWLTGNTLSSAFRSIMRFLGLFADSARLGKLFPMSLVTHAALLVGGFLLAMSVYQSVSLSLFESYQTALTKASVVCRFLTDFGSSSHFNCDGKVALYEGLDANNEQTIQSPQQGIASTADKATDTEPADINRVRLSTKDLTSMMVAAGIEDPDDLEDPDTLLMLNKSGPGGWIATGILSSESPSGDHLDSVMIAGTTNGCPAESEDAAERERSAQDRIPFGSIYSLMVLYNTLGKKSDKTAKPCQGELQKIKRVADILIKNVTGPEPKFWSPFQEIGTKSASDAIKSAMTVPWGHYMPSVIFHSPDDKDCNKDSNKLPREIVQQKTTNKDLDNFYESDRSVCIQETTWYRYDPTSIYHAMFSFSTFILNEVFRDSEVKTQRFFYQAWRGSIQFVLLVIFFYVLLIVVWRFIAAFMQRGASHIHFFHRPTLVQGPVHDKEQQIRDSRAFVDLMINTLPLIGLFGTVVGILFGLPNAAAAVTAVGPGASDAVNALFENLGLAFSTTAIAVLSVIILEVLWLILQNFEEHAIAEYLEKQAPN